LFRLEQELRTVYLTCILCYKYH